MSIEIGFELECVVNNLADKAVEWGLTHYVFLTGHFERTPVIVHTTHEGAKANVVLKGKLPAGARGEIPALAAVCFAGIAYHRNDSGVPVMVDIGTSHILLSELNAVPTGKTFKKDVHLKMHTVDDQYEKAVIRITANKSMKISSHLKFAPMHISAELISEHLNSYLKSLYMKEMSMRNTIPGTDNIRAFIDISEEAFQSIGAPIPALTYAFGEIPKSNALFWENALTNVLKREDMTINDFMNMDKQQKARFAFLLIDYPVTILPYIGDMVDRRSRRSKNINAAIEALKVGCENFGECLALLGGDCEDLIKGITKIQRALKLYIQNNNTSKTGAVGVSNNYKYSNASKAGVSNNTNASSADVFDTAIRQIDAILDQYVILMSLCVVHGAKADDDSSMPKGAHMAGMGFPVHYFKDSMERTDEGKALAKQLPWPSKIDRAYEFNIAEGTGMLDPRGYVDPKQQVRGYVHFNAFKTPMAMEHGGESPFFLGALQGWTTYFADRGASKGVGAFWYKHTDNETRGSLYTDFTNQKTNVALQPMPEVPIPIQQIMVEANAFCIPPEPLILSSRQANVKNKLLDDVVKHVASLRRSPPPKDKTTTVSQYICPHQMNKEVSTQLISHFNDRDRIWKVEYEREAVTDAYHGYRLISHVRID
jgi:hypothetical protein